MAFTGHIDELTSLRKLSNHDLWQYILSWLSRLTENASDQEFLIVRQPPIKAFVKRVTTSRLAGEKFEAHQKYADLHYCLTGGEVILTAPTAILEKLSDYDASSDNVFYGRAPQPQSIKMHPGDIALLFPDDAHLPGRFDGQRQSVLKAIVKVPIELFNHTP